MSNRSRIYEILNGNQIEELKDELYSTALMISSDIMLGIEPIEAYQDIIKAFKVCIEYDIPEAWIELGNCYLCGEGVEENEEKAIKCFRNAYDAGYLPAAGVYLNEIYFYQKKYEEVLCFSQLLVKSGDKEGYGHYYLGLMKYSGNGINKNLEESFQYHQKAAELGNADAMFELYIFLSTGQGCEKNDKLSLEYLKKAAELDNHRACYNLGSFYATGKGMNKDINQAAEWYRKAVDNGNGRAAATLGIMYLQGELELNSDENLNDVIDNLFDIAEENNFDVDQFLKELGIDRYSKEKLI